MKYKYNTFDLPYNNKPKVKYTELDYSEEGIKEKQELIYTKMNDLKTKLDNLLNNIRNELTKDKDIDEDKLKEFENILEYLKEKITIDYKNVITNLNLLNLREYTSYNTEYLSHQDGIITYLSQVIITPFNKHYNLISKLNSITSTDLFRYNNAKHINNLFNNIKIHDCFELRNNIERKRNKNEYNEDFIHKLHFFKYNISFYRDHNVNFIKLDFYIIKTYHTRREENITHDFLLGNKLNIEYDRSLLTIVNQMFNAIDKQNIVNMNKEIGFYNIEFFDKENNIFLKFNTIKSNNLENFLLKINNEIM